MGSPTDNPGIIVAQATDGTWGAWVNDGHGNPVGAGSGFASRDDAWEKAKAAYDKLASEDDDSQ